MSTTRDIAEARRLLSAADPVPPTVLPDNADHQHAALTLQRLLTEPLPNRNQPLVRRPAVRRGGAVALAGAAAITAVLWTSRPGEDPITLANPSPVALTFHRANPNESTATVLRRIARAAERQPDLSSQGRYDYRKTVGWYREDWEEAGKRLSKIHLEQHENWTASDGSGRILIYQGDKLDMDELSPPAEDYTPYTAQDLPTDTTELRRRLRAMSTSGTDLESYVDAMQEIYRQGPVPPAQRAALLRALAELTGPRYEGTVTDRANRQGLAVSVESKSRGGVLQITLIFDSQTGDLLDAEELLLQPFRKPSLAKPELVSYTVYLTSGRVNNVNSRPTD